jgi:membrane protease subunit HflK
MQEVFSSTSKVLVTGNKNGQSNLLYLPLDKMIQNSSGSSAPVTGSAAASNNTDVVPHVTDLPQTRTRETR